MHKICPCSAWSSAANIGLTKKAEEPGVHFTLMEEGGQLGLQWIMSNGGSAGLDGEIMSKLGLEVMPG